jgi:hypothetical protein
MNPLISRNPDNHPCKCNEEYSTYNKLKTVKKEIIDENDAIISEIKVIDTNSKFTYDIFKALKIGRKLIDEKKYEDKKLSLPSQGRQLFTRWSYSYPNSNKTKLKTFYIRYDKNLSSVDKVILNNFRHKYLYHAIDDILYSLKLKPIEQNNILAILYSPVLYLQNNFSIDFFDIWIDELYINQIAKVNKFLTKSNPKFESYSYITIKLLYTIKVPTKKTELLW